MNYWMMGISFFVWGNIMAYTSVKTAEDVKKLFAYEAIQIEPWITHVLQAAQQQIDALCVLPPSERTFGSVFGAYDRINASLTHASQIVQTLAMVHTDAAMREACQTAAIRLEEFCVEQIGYNQRLFVVLSEYAALHEPLSAEKEYYVDEIIKAYIRSGAREALPVQEEIKGIKKELASLALCFETNINKDIRTLAVPYEALVGVSAEVMSSWRRDEQGNYLLGTDYPTYAHIMENCAVESTRKALWALYVQRAYPHNSDILSRVIALRDRLARLLGCESYAHLIIADSMAQSPERVEQFLEDMIARCQPKAERECALLGIEGQVKPWNMTYIKSEYKRRFLTVDEEVIAAYFPMEHTCAALLGIYEEFLGVRFQQLSADGLWHPACRLIAVYEQDRLAGYLVLDLFPRPHKYTHACQITIVPAVKDASNVPVAVVLANFPPAADAAQPPLLKRQDVITFFHEFGHALHALFGATELHGCSGTNVKMDFVELPSQMLEEWMWETGILQRVSAHYKTGEPLPVQLIEKIQRLKHFDSGDATLRQLVFALLSLECFKSGENKNVDALRRTINGRVRPYISQESEDHFEAAFGHLMGYGPQYYGYLWSKVYAIDLFSHIKERGILHQETGRRYKECVLAKGGSCPPQVILREFLGREPQVQPFLENLGL